MTNCYYRRLTINNNNILVSWINSIKTYRRVIRYWENRNKLVINALKRWRDSWDWWERRYKNNKVRIRWNKLMIAVNKYNTRIKYFN